MPGIGNYDVQYTLILKDQMTKTLAKAEAATKGFNSYVTAGSNQVAGMFSKANVAMGVVAASAWVAGKAIKNAMDFEQTQISFEVLLGSADRAKTMLADLEKFAISTPFESKDLLDSTKLLLNFGVAEKKIMPLMQQLGDITAGDAVKLHSMSLAFGQMSSTGRLMGQDLNQMINAGFNPLEYIAKRTGKSMAELKKDMERGRISVEMVEQAFADATGEGGRFNGMMEKQSKSMSGQWSTAVDKFNVSLRKLGQITLPELTSTVKGLNALMDGDFKGVFTSISEIQDHSRFMVEKWGRGVLGMNEFVSDSYFDLKFAVSEAATMTSTQLTSALDKAKNVYGATNQQVEYFLSLMQKQKEVIEQSSPKKKGMDEMNIDELQKMQEGFENSQKLSTNRKDFIKDQKEIDKIQKRINSITGKSTGGSGGGGGSTSGTSVSSRAPQYFNVTIGQLTGDIYTKRDSINQSDSDLKRVVAETFTEALNDTQLIAK